MWRLIKRWETIKANVLLFAVLAFISDIKSTIELAIEVFQIIRKNVSKVEWHSVIEKHFHDWDWLNFISKVALLWMFILLNNSIAKTKQELVADQQLLTRLLSFKIKWNNGLPSHLPMEEKYLYYLQTEFSGEEIKRLIELKAIQQDYTPEKYKI